MGHLSKLFLSAQLLVGSQAALYDQVIETQTGPVQGYRAFNSSPAGNLTNWQNIAVWKGIPFAATTAGQNRWRPPQPAIPWNTTLYASAPGNVCPSATSAGHGYVASEDCLNLNIWSSANSSDAKLPVVMWSYPALSTAADALFDGGGMADKNVVFVNYNYRAGVLGWLAHPELSAERLAFTGYNSSGNWAMLDQFAALKWIKANIAAFGGDPDHITVMGQSAGSAATYHILNSPLTKGLIVGAIIQSGVRDPHDPLCTSLAEGYITLNTSLSQGVKFVSSLNVSTIAEARALPMTSVTSAFAAMGPPGMSGGYSWEATLDYYAMPGTYLETLQKGAANDVPIITGNTKDESGATYGLNITLDTYLSDLNTTYNGSWVEDFFTQYPANDSASASSAENAQFTDRSKIGTWLWSQLWKPAGNSSVYNYFWDHAPPNQNRGAYHESEINYVLNNLYGTNGTWQAQDYQIATVMNGYWVNFIKTGNPNGAGLVNWAPANDTPLVQRVGNAFESIPVADGGKLALVEAWFESLPAY